MYGYGRKRKFVIYIYRCQFITYILYNNTAYPCAYVTIKFWELIELIMKEMTVQIPRIVNNFNVEMYKFVSNLYAGSYSTE